MQVVTRPWCERPPPGYPLPLNAQAGGSGRGDGERRCARRGHGRRVAVARVAAPGVRTMDSSRELVLWAAMPPSTWIRFHSFFSAEMPPRGPLELWLQHADCDTPATGAEVETVSSGKIFMTRGWGKVARVCRVEGALMIQFEYDDASVLFFKVFNEKAAALSATLKEVARMAQRRAQGLPQPFPAAPPAPTATPSGPVTLPSS